jgi:hypothetical protein
LQSEKDPNQKEDEGESPSLSLSEHDTSYACRSDGDVEHEGAVVSLIV